ncbi:hypothetical protein [Streptomyces sp. NPDC021212]|uniref:hypothetical protein n=1 Tax=Streptomyces sp. NPDC021212 TaxID=3365118 RepID=UPI0037AF3352
MQADCRRSDRTAPENRGPLRDRTLRTQRPDGLVDEHELTVDQAVEELRDGFRITLSEEEAAAVRAFLE